jgi:hypothetical protein
MQKENIVIQSNNSKLMLQVNNDLTVEIQTNPEFNFLMNSNMVALGYGVSPKTIRSHKMIHKDELIENIHFISRAENIGSRSNLKNTQLLWTKAGVIRLGFFIRSERAKVFRDWAESIVLQASAPMAKNLPAVHKRNHNRLSQERLVGILADICKIEDSKLRLSLIEKLGVC